MYQQVNGKVECSKKPDTEKVGDFGAKIGV